MQAQQLFAQASLNFQQEQYQQGLALVDKCITLRPSSSALYTNRAVFHSQMGSPQDAISDLQKAITLNHLNYVAYFNLSSLQLNQGDHSQAFNNLCCSLSCLYLIRARKARRQIDVQRSIKYAQNNFEAHVLKALMFLQDGKQRLAMNEVEWAEDIQPHSPLPHTLKLIIQREPISASTTQAVAQQHDKSQAYRLQSTYVPNGQLQDELKAKVGEFNEIFDQLINNEFETITQKVQRIKGEDLTRFQHSYNKPSQIYSIKPKNTSVLGGLRQSRNRSAVNPPLQTLKIEENLLEEPSPALLQSEEVEPSQIPPPEKTNPEDENLLLDNPSKEEEVSKTKEEPGLTIQKEQIQEQQLHLSLKQELNESKQEKKRQYPGTDRVIQEDKKSIRSRSLGKNTPHSSSRTSVNEVVPLYPVRGGRKKIQFTIIGAELKNTTDVKDVYVTGNYHSRKGQVIKTPNKKLEGNLAKWYYNGSPTNLSEQPQTITLNLFNKRYFGKSDMEIGSGEVEVINTGEIRCPVYFKAKVTGFVELKVDLI